MIIVVSWPLAHSHTLECVGKGGGGQGAECNRIIVTMARWRRQQGVKVTTLVTLMLVTLRGRAGTLLILRAAVPTPERTHVCTHIPIHSRTVGPNSTYA